MDNSRKELLNKHFDSLERNRVNQGTRASKIDFCGGGGEAG